MEKLLKLQILIAYLMVIFATIYCFIVLSSNKINFLNLSSHEQFFYSCIILSEIIYILTIIYGILKCFWNTITCCWRSNNETNNNNFTWKKGFTMILFIMCNATFIYYIYFSKLTFPDFMINIGNMFINLIIAVFSEGIIFYLIRKYLEKKENDKPLLPINNENN